jgi:hypothetical protein
MGIGGVGPPFLPSALDGGEWSASHPGLFTSGEIAPRTHWMGGRVGVGAGLGAVDLLSTDKARTLLMGPEIVLKRDFQATDTDDSPRRFYQIQPPRKL